MNKQELIRNITKGYNYYYEEKISFTSCGNPCHKEIILTDSNEKKDNITIIINISDGIINKYYNNKNTFLSFVDIEVINLILNNDCCKKY